MRLQITSGQGPSECELAVGKFLDSTLPGVGISIGLTRLFYRNCKVNLILNIYLYKGKTTFRLRIN